MPAEAHFLPDDGLIVPSEQIVVFRRTKLKKPVVAEVIVLVVVPVVDHYTLTQSSHITTECDKRKSEPTETVVVGARFVSIGDPRASRGREPRAVKLCGGS